MFCFLTQRLIQAYLGGALPSRDEELLRRHCEHCPRCARALREAQGTAQLLAQLPRPSLPVDDAADLLAQIRARGQAQLGERLLGTDAPLPLPRKRLGERIGERWDAFKFQTALSGFHLLTRPVVWPAATAVPVAAVLLLMLYHGVPTTEKAADFRAAAPAITRQAAPDSTKGGAVAPVKPRVPGSTPRSVAAGIPAAPASAPAPKAVPLRIPAATPRNNRERAVTPRIPRVAVNAGKTAAKQIVMPRAAAPALAAVPEVPAPTPTPAPAAVPMRTADAASAIPNETAIASDAAPQLKAAAPVARSRTMPEQPSRNFAGGAVSPGAGGSGFGGGFGGGSAPVRVMKSVAAPPEPQRAEKTEGLAAPESDVAALLRALSGKSEEACAAARTLGQRREKSAVSALAHALRTHPDAPVREAAAQALAAISTPEATAALRAVAAGDTPGRDAARRALPAEK